MWVASSQKRRRGFVLSPTNVVQDGDLNQIRKCIACEQMSNRLTSHVNHADTHDLRLVVATPIPRCSRERAQDGRIPFKSKQ